MNLKSLFWPDGVRHLWSMMKASSGDNWKGRPLLRSCSNVLSIAFNTERSDVKRFLLTSYCLSSSQTWVIFLPNRNFPEKVISWPAGPPKVKSQNEGYQQYLFIITGKLDFLFMFLRKKMCSMKSLLTKIFKTVIDYVLNSSWSQAIWFIEMMFSSNDEIFSISFILTSDFEGPYRPSYWLLIKFLLGKKIAHVWEEEYSLVCSFR